ncbi:hypothetical protein [Halobiforma nitratireducens]|uniref:Uncharacterized protein n=1 Tax=Halobiforma nitratireducens JCM 10879 TaxID=1227454 RepID=M0MHR2_9EURY|nr:hypothetical protein [Halobiforma nitratireducens]EMA45241.1 hypothetical protein C446_02507 [Halobiforma nitratireducens JCM 10879]
MVFVLAISMVGAGLTGSVAATDHTTTLEGDGEDAVVDFDAADDEYLLHTIEADGADFGEDGTETVYFNVSYDDTEHETYSAVVDDEDADYEVNISESDLESVPGDADDTTTVEVTTWGEDADDETTTDADTFAVDLEFAADHATAYVDDPEDHDEIEPGFFSLATLNVFDDADETVVQSYEETVGIADNETEVTVYDDTADGDDAWDEVVADDLESGDVMLSAAATVDGEPVAMFYDEADDDLVDETEDTYIVYDGDDAFTVNLGDEFDEDSEEIDVFIDSQNALEADLDADEVGELYADTLEFGYMDLQTEFGVVDTLWNLGVGPLGLW